MHTKIYLIFIPVISDTEDRSEIAKIINNFNPIQEYFVKTYNKSLILTFMSNMKNASIL